MSPVDPEIESKLRRTGIEFLSEDLQAALTFAQLARSADPGSEKKLRNIANARKAYEVVKKLAGRLHLSPEQQTDLDEKLRNLKTELEDLGEHF